MGIYQIRNVINDKVYIGSSQNIFHKRWPQHLMELKKNKHHCDHLQNAWNKYGEKSFTFEKIEDVNKKKDLKGREQWYLDNIIRWDFDYNSSRDATSGMGGRKHSEETKKRMSKAHSGKNNSQWRKRGKDAPNWKKEFSKETKIKMSEAQKGENGYWWGKTLSKEHKEKISNA